MFPYFSARSSSTSKDYYATLMLEALMANKRRSKIEMQRISTYHHLLVFNYFTLNTTIPFLFPPPDTRTQRQKRPKTGGFWTEVFPYLIDGHNSFRRHFRITRVTFHAIVSRLEAHPAFISNAINATPVWKQIALVLWRLANGAGIQVLEQTLGISQGSVSHFTNRFLKALLRGAAERF